MHVRTFVADTAHLAMAQVREELGPEAVIIAMDTAARGRGVVIRAALDQVEAEIAEPAQEEVVTPFEQRLEQMLAARLRTPVPVRMAPPAFSVQELTAALAFHRLPEALVQSLAQTAAAFEASDIELSLARALERHITLSPLPILPSRPVVLIGAPGAGKTSVAARLALRAATSGATTVLATLDGAKAGARAQLETYANLIGATAHTIDDANAARALIEKNAGAQIFIDTPGVNIFDRAELSATQALISNLSADALAVIPAGLDADEATELAELYAATGATRFVCTRTDATRRLGGMITAATKLGLSHLTNSPFLGNGVETPHSLKIGRVLLAAGHA